MCVHHSLCDSEVSLRVQRGRTVRNCRYALVATYNTHHSSKHQVILVHVWLGPKSFIFISKGESVLHMTIVNEDPTMVKFLLDAGADYHERCCGNFMCPEDQKASRSDSLDHEWVNVTRDTNYVGYVFISLWKLKTWGGLSFPAVEMYSSLSCTR